MKKKNKFKKLVDYKKNYDNHRSTISHVKGRKAMRKSYINHLCIIVLASTLYACGGSSNNNTPSAPTPQAANSSSSSSGGPIIVNFTGEAGESIRYNFPANLQTNGTSVNDPAGGGFLSALNGVDLRQFTATPTPPTTGNATLNGYLEVLNVAHLSTSQRFIGASNLEFNFSNNTLSGNANNFGVYVLSAGAGLPNDSSIDCTVIECTVYTRTRNIDGTLTIAGTRANSNINLTLMGTLTDNINIQSAPEATPISITHNFDNIALSGTLRTTTPTSNALLVRTNNVVDVPRTTGSASSASPDPVRIRGLWRGEVPAAAQ